MKLLYRIIIAVAFLLFVLRALCPIEWTTLKHDGLLEYSGEIVLLNPWVKSLLNWSTFAALGLLILLAIALFRKKRRKQGILLILFGLVCFIGSLLIFTFSNLSQWVTYDTKQGPQGELYSFLSSEFLQGQTLVITKRKSQNFFVCRETIIGGNTGDNPQSWATLLRPGNDIRNAYGQLYLTDSGWLIGMRYANHCFLAYYLPDERFYGHDDVEHLSPYLLLASNHRLYRGDLVELRERLKKDPTPRAGIPSKSKIMKGLDHPNPLVRRAAELLLDAIATSQQTQSTTNPTQ